MSVHPSVGPSRFHDGSSQAEHIIHPLLRACNCNYPRFQHDRRYCNILVTTKLAIRLQDSLIKSVRIANDRGNPIADNIRCQGCPPNKEHNHNCWMNYILYSPEDSWVFVLRVHLLLSTLSLAWPQNYIPGEQSELIISKTL